MAKALNRKIWGLGLLKRQPVRRFHPQEKRQFWFSVLLLALLLVGMALLQVWLRLQVVHLGYVLSTTSKLHARLEQENRELKVELATLLSPQRLEEMASARLGMREPKKGQVAILP
ncbi:MAG: cell division protein FtsL [Candidatus Binatia bacterium]